ncbi:atp-binding cassette sub-family b [Holotrichia oblita]|nr:atp-binding cassette sub-family b [Holotrichia oblita]
MKIEEIEGELTSITQENLTGIRVVKAFANEKYENDKFDKNMDNYYKVVKRINLKMSFFWSLSDLLIFIPLMIALWRTIDLALSPVAALSASSAVGIFMLIQNTLWPVRNLGRTISEIGRTSIACKRINEILNKKEEYDNDGTIEKNISGDIVFSNVSYKYENEYVLKNINLHIKPGEKIALIGRTGSGKSTLVHLINRMFDPSEGEILIDSVPTTSYKKHSLRRQIGVAMQEAFLFSRTIKDNIRISDLNISLDDVRRSAKIACIDDDIMGFAQGYDTLVGERGVTLSGGQKQRVAIARALVCAHPIIIFDDSLSALDTETDLKIQQALDKEQIRATTIIITHRIVTARKADRIIILEDGCISASGTHQELIKQDGLYQAIYNIQAAIQQSGDDKDA